MKYLITYHYRPKVAQEDPMNQGQFTELVPAEEFELWFGDMNESIVVITLFEKIGVEDYIDNLRYN